MNWSLIGICVTLCLALIVWVRRRYFTRPELTIELKFDRGHSRELRKSNIQCEPDEIVGTPENPIYVYDAEKALRIWEKKMEYGFIHPQQFRSYCILPQNTF